MATPIITMFIAVLVFLVVGKAIYEVVKTKPDMKMASQHFILGIGGITLAILVLVAS